LFELFTGKILFSGRNNNEMLKFIMQNKGRIPLKLLKKGQFSNLYFDLTTNEFLSQEIDQSSKKEYVKPLFISEKPVKDFFHGIQLHSHYEEKDLLNFKDFLDKCLALDYNKRFNAIEALCHPFFMINPLMRK
jgi:serine/threonine-protein kinase PRP4